jgi:capsular exopolysaccharide synthesis family protein
MSLGDALRAFNKHKLFILICALLGLAIAAVFIHFSIPIYEASATLRIDPNRASSLGLNDLISSSASAQDPLKTEALILHSDAVAIAALQSMPDDQFRELTGSTKAQMRFPASLSMQQQQEDQLNGRAPVLSLAQENVIARIKAMVTVKPVDETQVLTIGVRNKNPEIAATLANHIVYAYLRNSFDSRYSSVAQVQTWLQEQLDTLKLRATQSQKRLAEFQQQNNITGTGTSNTVIERLQTLNSRLSQAQADRIVKEAEMRAAMNADVATLATLYPSIGLQALQSQQASLYARYAELSTKFGTNYPPLAEVIVERKSVDAQLARLVDTTRDRLRQEFDVAKSTEALLQQQFDEQTQRVYSLNSKQADYAVLQAEGSASRDLYDKLQYQLQQAGISAGLNAVNTMVVSSARAPHRPVEPKVTLDLSFGVILGLFSGALSAFLFDAIADKLQTVAQVESTLDVSTLATIPHDRRLQRWFAGGQLLLPLAFRKPTSKVAEAFRTLRNSLFLGSIDNPPKVVLITSSFAGEGKTVICSNYGVTLAQSGASVLLVDIDLRRPRLHSEFALTNNEGLSDLLLGGPEIQPMFHKPLRELANLTVLTAGKTVDFPSEALGSAKFRSFVELWRKEYDFILLDSAPLLVVSDTLPVTKHVDAVMLITRFDATPVRAAQRAVYLLRRARAKLAGVVINDVPMNGLEYGSYYGYGYGYYSDDQKGDNRKSDDRQS